MRWLPKFISCVLCQNLVKPTFLRSVVLGPTWSDYRGLWQCKGQRAEATLDINLEILWVPWFAHSKQLLNSRPCYFWLVVVMMVSMLSGVASGTFLYCADEEHLAFFFTLISHPWHFLMWTIFILHNLTGMRLFQGKSHSFHLFYLKREIPINFITKPVSSSVILTYSQEMQWRSQSPWLIDLCSQ